MTLKKKLYFFVASYFRFFASIYLARWQPKVIVVTGSQGKTTLLHLLESQIGERALYSHLANSAFGVPFHVLGFSRKSFGILEWVSYFFLAPFRAYVPIHKERFYIVEADCDRPGEGKFLASFLKPALTLWVSVSGTHTINFKAGDEEATVALVVKEFSEFAKHTSELVIANGDMVEIEVALTGIAVPTVLLYKKDFLEAFHVDHQGMTFVLDGKTYIVPRLIPIDAALSVKMTVLLCDRLGIAVDSTFSRFTLPPGRSSVFTGIKNTTLIDSSYNASLESMEAMLSLFKSYQAASKWIVLGDMIELGRLEESAHRKLAQDIRALNPDRIVLVGPRLARITFPVLSADPIFAAKTVTFIETRDAREYVQKEIKGGEAILFKGARFLEAIIESLLYNRDDAANLPRRGAHWQHKRSLWRL